MSGDARAVLSLLELFAFYVVSLGRPSIYLALKSRAVRVACLLGLHERRHLTLLSKIVPPGSTAIDVGANCGVYAVRLSRLVGNTGRVLAFEPNPMVFEGLRRDMARGGNVECLPLGLSNARRSETLQVPLLFGRIPEPANASLEAPLTERSGVISRWAFGRGPSLKMAKIRIATERLDAFADQLRNVSFIKVDIEGHEWQFLEWAMQVIEKWRPVIQFETYGLFSDDMRYFSLARSLNYTLCYLDGTGSLRPIESGRSADLGELFDYYLVPGPHHLPE